VNKRRPKGEGALFTDSRGYWIGEITLPSGKKKRKYSKLQKEVKDWLREQRNAIHAGNWVEKEKVTFEDFLNRYMDESAKIYPASDNLPVLYVSHQSPYLAGDRQHPVDGASA
jgi:hypothetical protein